MDHGIISRISIFSEAVPTKPPPIHPPMKQTQQSTFTPYGARVPQNHQKVKETGPASNTQHLACVESRTEKGSRVGFSRRMQWERNSRRGFCTFAAVSSGVGPALTYCKWGRFGSYPAEIEVKGVGGFLVVGLKVCDHVRFCVGG